MKTKTVTLTLTEKEAEALYDIARNGWGSGDFAGYANAHIPTQKRALKKLSDVCRLGEIETVPR